MIKTIEQQYQFYLKKMNLHEDQMRPEQKKQLREAFYGGIGIVLLTMLDETSNMPMEEAINAYQGMINQVAIFFKTVVSNMFSNN